MPYRFQAFDKAVHDRSTFRSGVDSVDRYIQRTAAKLNKADNVRFFVMVDVDVPETILGFYTLNAHAIDFLELPEKYKRSAPGHGSIPAAFIAMMGVTESEQGRGLGSLVLADALKRVTIGAESIGTAVVLLDVLDDGVDVNKDARLRFYARFGFARLPSNPLRLFLPLTTVRASLPR